jgi:hypothetical protein
MKLDSEERRGQRRVSLRLPVQVQLGGPNEAVMGVTRNLSAKDAFFVVFHEFTPRPEIEFIVEFPSEITLTHPQLVRCSGITRRVESVHPEGVGVAVTINQYQFLGEQESRGHFRSVATRELYTS